MRVLVVGAGAVGGYFGARLVQAGRDVTFLVRERRAQQLRAGGLRLVTPAGAETFAPQIEITGEIATTYDAILVAVKAYALDGAMRDLAPAVGSETMIVPLLNGMRHLDALVARFGEDAVLGGVSMVSTRLEPDGTIRQLGWGGALTYGERAGGISPRVDALHAQLDGAGFDATASPHIMAAMWRKWTMLAAIGALSCLMRGSVGDVEAAGGTPTVSLLLDEVLAVATASGYGLPASEAGGILAFLTAKGSENSSSMYRDLVAGNAIEGEHIIGDLVARARSFGIATPLLDATLVHLRVYSNGLAARGSAA